MRWRTIAFRSILWYIQNDTLRLFLGASTRRTFVDESRNGALGIQIRIPSSSRPPFAHCRESVRYQAVEIRDRALPKVVQVVRGQKVERVFISPSLYRDNSRIGGTRLPVRRISGLLSASHRRDDRSKWGMGFLEATFLYHVRH